jgi:phage FluMu protein Com
MPLKIRCPHCFRVLVAADETAGQAKLCPACGQVFNVPLLPREVHETPEEPAGPKCPRCGGEIALAATYCPKCHTDLTTGRRLPLVRRLRLRSWRFWVTAGLAAAGGALVVLVAVQIYVIGSRPAPAPFRPAVPRDVPAAELAQQLLAAHNTAERTAVLLELGGIESRVAPAVATALAASVTSPTDDPQLRWDQIAAIDLLARHGRTNPNGVPQWLELLTRCGQDQVLYEAALRARALLGDESVAKELGDLWLAKLRRWLLLGGVIHAGRLDEQAGARLILRQAADDLARCAEGLRVLGQAAGSSVFDHLAEAYWSSWNWLGQGRGDRLADELFDLAKPAEQTLEFKPEDVRQPRDVMKAIAARGSPAARAAAGMVLEQRGPQYKSLCRSIADALGPLLAECDAADQQRLTWTIERLRGNLFGLSARAHPLDITADQIAAALQWARPTPPPAPGGSYPQPPDLVCRVVPAARLLERDLLAEMQRGWPEARHALDRWLAADLGCTPRVRELLYPGQRRPNYPALAAGFVIVAQGEDESVRSELELWHEATDQPRWVRALAYTVLASLDAQRGRWSSGWPVGLDLGDTHLLDAGTPGWDAFGRVLAAGGPDMLQRLGAAAPAALPPEVGAKLLDAAKTAAARAVTQRD